ncbi:hypothetical protein DFJ77DRAFT_444010 [Powellomyces hirtus]|nr:hypothetical protein DFJ77DRAFT_444010 [Powellomyces hirtus]
MSAHRQCNPSTPSDCMSGTSCMKHGQLNLCLPTNLSNCTKVDPLFVTPINNVYTMFCDTASMATAPANSASLPCANYEMDHGGQLCLLKACTSAQLAANDQTCWLEELPNGAAAAPDVPESERKHHGCTTNADCKIAGTSCTKHGALNLCIPDDRSKCIEVDPLFVVPVDNVFTMFCNSATGMPSTINKPPCDPYESAHGDLCMLPACTESQTAKGATTCWLEALPSSAPGSGVTDGSSSSSAGLSVGAKAGIGAAVGIVALAIGFIAIHKHRRSQRKARLHHVQI